MRLRRTLVTLCAAAAAALATAVGGALVATAPPAQAATLRGYDISWPQCPGGEPMPPTTAQFVVIGLTNGLAFTENPCVASQRQWSVTNAIPAHAYAMATWPTAAQYTQYKAAGPYTTVSSAGTYRNVGYAEGVAAAATLSRIGWKPPVVWVDVEPRPKQPWPALTTRQQVARNRWVVEGLLRALEDRGYAVGVYSSPNAWTEVVGTWWLPGIPTWVTVGPRGEAAALTACTTPSWSGGPVFLAQHWNDDYDFDVTCPAWNLTPPKPPAPSERTNDVTGDWRDDLLAREASIGRLWLYPGNGSLTGVPFGPRIASGWSGWNMYNLIETPGDWNGDGRVDLVARDAAGDLWMYPGKGGTWGPRVRIGTGWQNMRAIVGAGDLTGDGRPDIVALHSTGTLYVYPGTGRGGFSPRRTLATGWSIYDRVVGIGDVTANGVPDLVVRQKSTGQLWLYRGRDDGTLGSRTLMGSSGWNSMALFTGPGDLTGDAVPDLVVRAVTGGALWLYPGRTDGTLAPRRQIGSGWQVMSAIA